MRDAKAYCNRGLVHHKKGRYDCAIGDYNRAIEIDPRDVEAYFGRGNAYKDLGQYDRATIIEDYDLNNPNDLEQIMRNYSGQYDHAIEDYDRALEINPSYAEVYNNRAIVYYCKGEYDKAWLDIHKAQGLGIQVNPQLLELLRQASGRQG